MYGKRCRGRGEVELAYPATTIEVTVTSPDTSATTTYTATVTRSEAKIGGTAVVGVTLTADTLGITDPDGLTGATFRYQWVRNDGGTDSDIEGATGATYVLAAEDEGTSVLVRVSFTDDEGNAETLTSPPTTEVEAALTAEFQRVPDTHESTTFVFHVLFSEPVGTSYQALWEHSLEMSNGIIVEARRVDGRNDLWEIEVQPRTHADVVVTLPPTADCADAGAVCTNNGKRLSSRLQITVAPSANSEATPVENSPATGLPAISGAAQVDETLTVDTSGIADADGLTGATFSYQWMADDSDIASATGSSYTLADADEGKAIKVRVSFTDDAGYDESLTSEATSAVRQPADVLVWQSELTPSRNADILPIWTGYSSVGDFGGTLSSNTFPVDGTTYTVQYLMHVSESLWLGMIGKLPVDFTLRVGDSTYVASESMYPRSMSTGAYWWPLESPDWSVDEPVQVSLSIHPGVPLEERENAPVTGHFRKVPPQHDGSEDYALSDATVASSKKLYSWTGVTDQPWTLGNLADFVLLEISRTP